MHAKESGEQEVGTRGGSRGNPGLLPQPREHRLLPRRKARWRWEAWEGPGRIAPSGARAVRIAGCRIYQQNGGALAIFDTKNKTWAAFTSDGIPQTMYKPRPFDATTNPGGYRTTVEDWLNEPGRGTEVR